MSVLAFDTGVVLVVIGVSIGMIQRLGEELSGEEEPMASLSHEADANPATRERPR